MLRITQSTSSQAAVSYYTSGLSREGYYAAESVGHWGGKAATALGLEGEVTKEQFAALAENRHPQTGERLTGRTRHNRTAGWDFTFSVPKDVSVLHGLTGDTRIEEAFHQAIEETMAELEAEVQARVRKDGADGIRTTGNLLYAGYTHYTSRPIDGQPDPHLHRHVYVFNATRDSKEDCWKAINLQNIKRDAPYYQAAVDARLAVRLSEMGYTIERSGKSWKVAGVEDSVREKFSRRTAEIEAEATKRGITSDKVKDKLGARTRQNKEADVDSDGLRELWWRRLDHREQRSILDACSSDGSTGSRELAYQQAAADSLDYALDHSLERASVVVEKRLLAEALRFGIGRTSVEAVKDSLGGRDDIVRGQSEGQKLVTTEQVLAEEKQMLELARSSRGTKTPLAGPDWHMPEDFFVIDAEQDISLGAGQQAAVRHVLDSVDGVMAIRGGAGTGKSTLLAKVQEALRENGHEMMAFAPTAGASRGVLREKGFEGADTVARLLIDEKLQEQIAGKVVLIDEAGLLSGKDMKSLLEMTHAQNARLLLVGDYKQHSSVDRGDAFRVLEKLAGIPMAQVAEIQRQRGSYKEAIAAISEGDLDKGFERLESCGAIQEIADAEQREAQLVGDYLDTVARNETALVVSPTHAEGDRITGKIRQGLRDRGDIGKQDRTLGRLQNMHLSEAQKRDAEGYREGDVIEFEQNVGSFRRGFRTQVVAKEAGQVWVADATGHRTALPLERGHHFSVLERKSLALAKNDTIRFTKNGKTLDGKHRINNGATYQIEGFTREGDIRLHNGWIIGRGFGHVTHGYVTTSHSGQGKDADRVLIAQSSLSWGASNQEQFYVSVSRGKKGARVYTDDAEQLRYAASRSGERLAASELVHKDEEANRFSRLDKVKEWFYRVADKTRQQADRIGERTRSSAQKGAMVRG